MKTYIIGAGALGSTIGGALAEAGVDVTLITRNRAHVDAIVRGGLTMRTDAAEHRIDIGAAVDTHGLPPADLVIILVKSAQTKAAIEAAKNTIAPHTCVLTLQNGLGHEDILGDAIGAEHIVSGKTYVGGQITAPGELLSGIIGRETIIGELDGSMSERILTIAALFEKADMVLTVSPNIKGVIWDKLLVNVATGALSAVTGLAYGDLYGVPEVKACAVAAVTEAMAVARAKGVTLSTKAPVDAWNAAAAGLPHDFKASMLQSLEKGARTEVDFINGAVVRAGAEMGVPTPVNATLVACVKGVERKLI
ncbi:MAG: ketopantoate reductase family protein [Alphaproteobacteria bacterium]|nr:ketopantoate reductase family protein [Alphaproteobacteria bacterium]